MVEYIIVRTDVGLIAGKIVDSDKDTYTLDFNSREIKVEKQYVYEENDVLFVEAHDIV